MAEKLGVLKMARPRPRVARAATTCPVGAEAEIRANCPVPAAVTTIPSAERPRDPRRSESRPAIGVMSVITAGWTSKIRPVTWADLPCTTSRKTAVKMVTP